jgi:hypothetical protein
MGADMSLFLQYQLGQALGDMGGASQASAGTAGEAAASGFGLGLGFAMPFLMMRAMHPALRRATPAWPGPHGYIGQHRFCGHCGAALVPGGRFCGLCGTATGH